MARSRVLPAVAHKTYKNGFIQKKGADYASFFLSLRLSTNQNFRYRFAESDVLHNLNFKARRNDCLALALIAAMTMSFCDEIIFSGKIPFFRDLAGYFYPIKFSVAEALKTGQLPLWEPHMATGFPLLAEFQSAIFYPPTVIFYALPFLAAIQVLYVFHYAVAASGSYVLLRSWKQPIIIAIIGAILFSFGGTTVSLTNLLNHFQSAVWLPWVLYCWERTVKTKRLSAFITFSIIAFCQLLAGSPEIFAFSLGLILLDTVRMYSEGECGHFWWEVGILGAAGLIVVGLAMVQLVPTAELILQSRRDQPIPAAEALAWSLRPSSLIGLLLPVLETDTSLSGGIRLLFTDKLPFLLSNYMGNVAVFGLCSWFFIARMKEQLVFLALLGCSLIFAFGSYTLVYPELYAWLPLLQAIRFPEKFYYISFVLLIFATIRGFRPLLDGKASRSTWLILLAVPASWLILYVIFCWDPNLLAHWIWTVQSGHSTADPTTVATVLVSLEKQIGISTILASILFLHRLKLLRSMLVQLLLVLAVFVDLSVANKPLHFLREKETVQNVRRIFGNPPADHGRIFYYPPGPNLHPSFVRIAGSPSYKDGSEIAINNLLPNTGLLYGFEYFQDIDALGRRSYTDFLNFINALPNNSRGRLLRALNVKYVVAFHPLDVKGLNLIREFPEHYSRLYEVADSVPRTYIVTRATYDREPFSTLQRLASDSFDPLNEVIIDAQPHVAPNALFQGEAAIEYYQKNKVGIDARLNAPGILVLTDAFYPGWKVLVDNHQQQILRANYLFRGVELAAGTHKVEFVYDPLSFKIGLAFSITTAAVLLAFSLIGWTRRRVICSNRQSVAAQLPVSAIIDP